MDRCGISLWLRSNQSGGNESEVRREWVRSPKGMSPKSGGNESEVRRELVRSPKGMSPKAIIYHLSFTTCHLPFLRTHSLRTIWLISWFPKYFYPPSCLYYFFFLPLHSRSTNAVFYSERGWQNFPNLFKTHKMHVKQVLNRGKLDFCVRTGINWWPLNAQPID